MHVKCISCGASQNWTDKATCTYCGGGLDLEPSQSNYQKQMQSNVGNLLTMAETAIEATNWEEALQYFNKVLENEITNPDAWLGKGIAIVYTSKIGELKINEAIAYWKNALKNSSNPSAMGKRVATEINEVVNRFYPTLENHFIQFKDLDNSYGELVDKFVILEKAIDYATQLDSNLKYFETGYTLCTRVIQIPKQYALADEGAAWAQGIIGAVQNNKYKTQDAVHARQKAVERKQEINRAALIVNELEEKYSTAIKKIDPNYSPTKHKSSVVDNNNPTNRLIISTYKDFRENKKDYFARTHTIKEIKNHLGLKQSEATALVNKVLIDNNLIDKAEIKKQERNAILLVVVIIIILLIIGSLSK